MSLLVLLALVALVLAVLSFVPRVTVPLLPFAVIVLAVALLLPSIRR